MLRPRMLTWAGAWSTVLLHAVCTLTNGMAQVGVLPVSGLCTLAFSPCNSGLPVVLATNPCPGSCNSDLHMRLAAQQ